MKQPELTNTQDMGLAIALLCMSYELIGLESNHQNKRVTFRFLNQHGIDEVTRDYWSGKLLVSAKNYWNESKNLKTRLYSIR
jgi:hypothetical protein